MEELFGDQRILYIQSNADTYLKKFNALETKEKKIGWNWCGFLFGPAWMIYRKMYGYATFFFLTPIFLDFLFLWMFSTEMFYLSTNLLCNLILMLYGGLYSDYWYKQKIDKLMRYGMDLYGEAKKQQMKKGGTNVTAMMVFIIISFVIKTLHS